MLTLRFEDLKFSLYVVDLILGINHGAQGQGIEEKSSSNSFTLHKWHSNTPELETAPPSAEDTSEATYAKQQLGTTRATISRMFGLPWNKERDTVNVEVPPEIAKLTKREILAKLARFYDPFGLISPETLRGKFIYQQSSWSHMAIRPYRTEPS